MDLHCSEGQFLSPILIPGSSPYNTPSFFSGESLEEDLRFQDVAAHDVYAETPEENCRAIANLSVLQVLHMPDEGYATVLKESWFDAHTRQIFVQWMLENERKFHFTAVTSWAAVNCFDRFMARGRKHWEHEEGPAVAAAIACQAIAAKHVEGGSPALSRLDFLGLRIALSPTLVQQMELLVLCELEWRVNFVTPYSFLDRLLAAMAVACPEWVPYTRIHANNFIRAALLEARFATFLPLVIAAAALLCALDLPECAAEFAAHGLDLDQGCSQLLCVIPDADIEQLLVCKKFMETALAGPHATPTSVLDSDDALRSPSP
eukprot:jgi/Chlat1/3233/Chrsp22S08809